MFLTEGDIIKFRDDTWGMVIGQRIISKNYDNLCCSQYDKNLINTAYPDASAEEIWRVLPEEGPVMIYSVKHMTEIDRAVLQLLSAQGYRYVFRKIDGYLYAYKNWDSNEVPWCSDSICSFIRAEDEEPYEIEDSNLC